MSCATTEPVEMSFVMLRRVSPGNHVLDRGADVPAGTAFLGECLAYWKA